MYVKTSFFEVMSEVPQLLKFLKYELWKKNYPFFLFTILLMDYRKDALQSDNRLAYIYE